MASLSMVHSTLKACVISNPEGVDEDRLNSEYRQLMGSNIPWRELKFKSLQDLIRASPSLQIVTRGGRKLVVAEAASANHLSAMISQQKKSTSSKRRKKTVRPNSFFEKRMTLPRLGGGHSGGGYGGRSSYGGNSSSSRNRPSFKKIDFVERNNNTNIKSIVPSRNNKEISHHTNARPAGDSSSSGSISPTYPSQNYKNPPKNPQKSKDQERKETKPAKEIPPRYTSKPSKVEPKKEKVIEKPKEVKKPEKHTEPAKNEPVLKPILKSPSVSFSTKPTVFPIEHIPVEPPVVTGSTPQTILNSYTRSSQKILLGQPDIIPEPIYFPAAPPITLQNTFVPDNLVPPKPMVRRSSYRGSKRRPPLTRLMSIKDDSTPLENSNTAKFISLIKAQEWPEPEYRLLPRIAPGNTEVYGCTVRGSYSLDNNETLLTYDYSTIPDEFSDKNESKEAVSKKAYDDMSNKIKEAANYVCVTSNNNQIIERVYNMVNGFTHGLWAYKVESDYKSQYGERLPSKWVDIITNTDLLVAEKLADFSYVIAPAQKSNGVLSDSRKAMFLGELEFPDTETWDIYVTKVVSSTEVWFRFVGPNYSDWLDEVTKQMCEHYQDWSMFVCPSPNIGDVYVYPSNFGAVRVRVISFDSPGMATVLNIDHGDIEEIPKDHLCVLDYNFINLPPQAVCCKMYDLEECTDSRICTAFLIDKIEGMVLVAEIVQTEPLELIMFDTSLDEPINLNQQVIDSLKLNLTTPPSFSPDVVVQNGVVTSIWKTGEIYLQLPNEGLTHLQLELEQLCDITPDNYLTHVEEVIPDVLYIVNVNGQWARATIVPPARPINNMVELILVDTGDLLTAEYTDLIPLSLVSMVLCEIPRQAVRVMLSGVNISESSVKKLQALIPPPCNTIIKVISFEPLEVELYIAESKGLISINSTLQLEENLARNLNSVSINTSGTEFVTIHPAPLPDCSDYFDVYIVSVSNPLNFTVIPRKYINELTKLQNKLQEHYNSIKDLDANRLRSIKIGQACAVKHSDNNWYRCLIERVMDKQMSQLLIRFCDFGNFAMIAADCLYALDRAFLNLPAVGINASIADIEPISGDWDITDCARVQSLMLEKNLVTLIKSKSEEQGQIYLKLQVFDTTGDNDCDIGDTLVEESRAKYVC